MTALLGIILLKVTCDGPAWADLSLPPFPGWGHRRRSISVSEAAQGWRDPNWPKDASPPSAHFFILELPGKDVKLGTAHKGLAEACYLYYSDLFSCNLFAGINLTGFSSVLASVSPPKYPLTFHLSWSHSLWERWRLIPSVPGASSHVVWNVFRAQEEQRGFCEAFISVSMKSSLVPLSPSLDALRASPLNDRGGVKGNGLPSV